MTTLVNTVLGPVPADDLGVVAVHEALLSVVPGAEHAYDVTIDRAAIFETLAARLRDFRAAGGGTVVDSIGMFHGRDLRLYEALSRATGVHVVASTGMGPEELLGGYFLTPQTNPPTPWPADRFAELFAREVTEGMVVPRVERRGPAGLVTTTTTRGGRTATDESLLQGVARAALGTGAPVSLRIDDVDDLDVVLKEGLPADRVAVVADDLEAAAARGVYVVVTDPADVARVPADRALLATGGVGISFGKDAPAASYADLLSALPDDLAHQVLVANPHALLTVKGN
jgi:phosphotriesterase-related protein